MFGASIVVTEAFLHCAVKDLKTQVFCPKLAKKSTALWVRNWRGFQLGKAFVQLCLQFVNMRVKYYPEIKFI